MPSQLRIHRISDVLEIGCSASSLETSYGVYIKCKSFDFPMCVVLSTLHIGVGYCLVYFCENNNSLISSI
jgi:hypothetical protein